MAVHPDQRCRASAGAGTVVGVIGDVEQSIYGFLDTHPEHFLSFSLPDYLDVTMRHNRRGTRRIIRSRRAAVGRAYGKVRFREVEGNQCTGVHAEVDRPLAFVPTWRRMPSSTC